MKLFSIILFLFFGWLWGSGVMVQEATKQEALGGRKESGKSIQYKFKLIAKASSDKIKIEDLWIGIEQLDIEVYTLSAENQKQKSFEKGDTIIVDAYQRFLPNENGVLEMVKKTNSLAPIEYEGEAVIRYSYKGKSKYIVINQIRNLPRLNYQ